MVSVSDLADELKSAVEFQQTPRKITQSEYEKFVINGIRKLYVDTGRAMQFDASNFVGDAGADEYDLKLDEVEYVLLLAQIRFYKTVQADVNEQMSYTTDALSVTGGDKPYKNLQDTISLLEKERRVTYYKMTRYALGIV